MAFSVLYSIKDEKGAMSTTEVNLPTSVDFADVVLFAGAMAQIINPLINGVITRIGVVFAVTLPGGISTTVTTGADVEEGARFQWKTSGGFYAGNRIPTWKEDKIIAGTREVNAADGAVAAFITAMVGGIDLVPLSGSGTVAPCDTRGEDLTSFESAVEQFLNSRSR